MSLFACPHCGGMVSTGAYMCPHCFTEKDQFPALAAVLPHIYEDRGTATIPGKYLSMLETKIYGKKQFCGAYRMECPVCGAVLPKDSSRCTVCGFIGLHTEFADWEEQEAWLQQTIAPLRKAYRQKLGRRSEFHIKNGCLLDYFGSDEIVIMPDAIQSLRPGVLPPLEADDQIDNRYIEAHGVFYGTKPSIVILPDGIQEIPTLTFDGCETLMTVIMPDTVERIGPYAFGDCKNLRQIRLSAKLQTIGEYAFQNCKALNSISFPGCVKEIGYGAFQNCTGLERVSFEDGFPVKVGPVFHRCSALRRVDVHDRGVRFSKYTFDEAVPLASCTGNGYEPVQCQADGRMGVHPAIFNPFWIDGGHLLECRTQDFLVCVPEGITSIDCEFPKGISRLVLPETVSQFTDWSFLNRTVVISSDNPNFTILNGALLSKDQRVLIRYPDGAQAAEYRMPNDVREIKPGAFYHCAALVKVILSEHVDVLESHTFSGCDQLTDVIFSTNLKQIQKGAFEMCGNLDSVILSRNTVVEDGAFPDAVQILSV